MRPLERRPDDSCTNHRVSIAYQRRDFISSVGVGATAFVGNGGSRLAMPLKPEDRCIRG